MTSLVQDYYFLLLQLHYLFLRFKLKEREDIICFCDNRKSGLLEAKYNERGASRLLHNTVLLYNISQNLFSTSGFNWFLILVVREIKECRTFLFDRSIVGKLLKCNNSLIILFPAVLYIYSILDSSFFRQMSWISVSHVVHTCHVDFYFLLLLLLLYKCYL